jgi:dipeptidyl aminopeptidase/acylaminoacyl peptidase
MVFEYVTYPDEGHGFLKRRNKIDFYTRLERFLDWYLL